MSWRIGISSGACTDCPILEVVPSLVASGAAGIEVGTPPRHFNPIEESQVTALRRILTGAALEAISIHAPFGGLLDLADPNPHHRHAAIGAALAAASAIKQLGGTLLVVHPSDLERHRHDVNARLADAARSVQVLAENCAADGVTLAIESPLPHLIGGHPDEFAWILQHAAGAVRVCLDTGHTALGRHWHRFLEVAGERLVHVHVNDNRGQRDDHLPPGDGIIDWSDVARSLRAARFEGWLMLELSCPDGDRTAYWTRAFDRTRTLFGDH
ncbi:MAG: sugar phosphate isomerase/epimerase family protein [Acidobacteriota bacterium]